MISRSYGCEFAFVEMISARSLVCRNKKTLKMLSSIPADRPLGVQLLGNDPQIICRAVNILNEYKFDIIDFNAACPVSKVTARGEGASLLKSPRKLGELLKVIVDNSAVPLTVKIRAGWDDSSVNARDVALYAQDAGVSGLFLHGRTRDQKYSGKVNYRLIRAVKESLEIPVIASGDAFSPHLIKKILEETGCDGVAIARGALGNPWIFRDTADFLNSGIMRGAPDIDEIADVMTEHLRLCIKYYGERTGTLIFRKFFIWYAKGLPGIKPLKGEVFRACTKIQMANIIEELRFSIKASLPA